MKEKSLYYTSFFYAIAGLLSGIFYREFTKVNEFEGVTILKGTHTHLLVLGFMFFLIVLILAKLFAVNEVRSFTLWFIVYNAGLVLTLVTMYVRGIAQVQGFDINGLNHFAGLGHAVLGAGIIWFMFMLGKKLQK
ncbi:DUF2871 domain-containing protein [Brevibacillus daliensis]|uniref:DUF2871 domain-containing protein n=1 Tax=Brevibacillus daliensis TaxID=2892995 RepID=UPI001E3D5837|nr:DUF2871 domain-containing protein [Brevibacillus daliensis]